MADPLDNIMSTLRKSGSIDGASAAVRKSRMKQGRTRAGASPDQLNQLTRKPPMQPARKPMSPNFPAPQEFGGPGVEMSQDPNMVATLIDQLNEAILSIKVQVNKTKDDAEKRKLENSAAILRNQIMELGGTPIEAEESVMEGLDQLEGKGFLGLDRLLKGIMSGGVNPNQEMQEYKGTTSQAPPPVTTQSTVPKTSTYDPNANDPGMLRAPGVHQLPHGYDTSSTKTQPRDQLESTLAGIGAQKAGSGGGVSTTTPKSYTKTPTTTYSYTPPETNSTGHIGIRSTINALFPDGSIRVSWDAQSGEVVVSGPSGDARLTPSEVKNGVSYASESDIIAAAVNAGAAELAKRPGAPVIVNGKVMYQPEYTSPSIDDVKEFMSGMGYDIDSRMTEEEYAALRRAEVTKSYQMNINNWQAQIEKFKNDNEASYNIAQRKVMAQAASLKGSAQEEMASRGMFYTSVMAGAMAETDKETMNILSDIAIEAANRVHEMDMEVTRLQEMQVLDETIAEFQGRLEYEDRSMQLVELGLQVKNTLADIAMREFALEWDVYQTNFLQNIEYWQSNADRVAKTEGELGLVRWALADPHVVEQLRQHGALNAVRNSDPATGAMLISNVLNISIPLKHNQESHDMNMALTASQIDLNRAQVRAIGAQASRERAQNWMNGLLQQYVMGNITDSDFISRMASAGMINPNTGEVISSEGALSIVASTGNILNKPQDQWTASERAIMSSTSVNSAYSQQGLNLNQLIQSGASAPTTTRTVDINAMSAIDANYLANSWRN